MLILFYCGVLLIERDPNLLVYLLKFRLLLTIAVEVILPLLLFEELKFSGVKCLFYLKLFKGVVDV